jgi:hypothetical protein
MATTGFRWAARLAGKYPAIIPTNMLMKTPSRKLNNDMVIGKPTGPERILDKM